jgi:hypothetical protein
MGLRPPLNRRFGGQLLETQARTIPARSESPTDSVAESESAFALASRRERLDSDSC